MELIIRSRIRLDSVLNCLFAIEIPPVPARRAGKIEGTEALNNLNFIIFYELLQVFWQLFRKNSKFQARFRNPRKNVGRPVPEHACICRQPEQKRAQARHRPAAGENPGTGRNPPAAPCGPVRRSARTERAFPAKPRRRTSARRPQREGREADGARHHVQPGGERESPHSARCAVRALNIRQRLAGTGTRKMRIIFSHYPPPGERSARRGSDKCRSSEETGPAC